MVNAEFRFQTLLKQQQKICPMNKIDVYIYIYYTFQLAFNTKDPEWSNTSDGYVNGCFN